MCIRDRCLTARGRNLGNPTARIISLSLIHICMVRQEQYMAELTTLMDAKQNEDADFVGTLYDALTPYPVSYTHLYTMFAIIVITTILFYVLANRNKT